MDKGAPQRGRVGGSLTQSQHANNTPKLQETLKTIKKINKIIRKGVKVYRGD